MPKPTGVATSTALRQLMLYVQQLITFIDRTHLFGRDNTQLQMYIVQQLGFLKGKHKSTHYSF